ncbi:hypothetical protein M378DRAFT_647394 [Amanita muscaria Koide BX008]|uniref:Uncharacterized protein n=1 Tax=Amanita muscaria (strain Koide BX008) TaxID=946122 RepID=A0A0C2X3V9_AMAMK|nr:hypothetical protein M378DRAFT_647394 [Amanita muscaria Koide BX008]
MVEFLGTASYSIRTKQEVVYIYEPYPTLHPFREQKMGSLFSAIGRALNSIVAAVADAIIAIINGTMSIIGAVFDVVLDILCCRCCSSSRTPHIFRSRHII